MNQSLQMSPQAQHRDSPSAINRRVTSRDLLSLVFLWAAMAFVVGGALSEIFADSQTPIALKQAEIFAQQIVAQQVDPKSVDRFPASVSDGTQQGVTREVGVDPWGTPYRYEVTSSLVIVYSAGPNKKFESDASVAAIRARALTHDEVTQMNSQAVRKVGIFQVDDVGYLLERVTPVSSN